MAEPAPLQGRATDATPLTERLLMALWLEASRALRVGPRPDPLDARKLDDDQALGRPLALQRFDTPTGGRGNPPPYRASVAGRAFLLRLEQRRVSAVHVVANIGRHGGSFLVAVGRPDPLRPPVGRPWQPQRRGESCCRAMARAADSPWRRRQAHGPLPAAQARIAAIEIATARRVGHSPAPRQVDQKHRMCVPDRPEGEFTARRSCLMSAPGRHGPRRCLLPSTLGECSPVRSTELD